MLMANAPAANVGLAVHAKAGVHTPVSACASSNEAISLALDLLRLDGPTSPSSAAPRPPSTRCPSPRSGRCRRSRRRNDDPEGASRSVRPRPRRLRHGRGLGDHGHRVPSNTAKARGARIYGTIAGAGITADSHDIAQPDPTGEGQSGAMIKALADAKLSAADIVHVNAHGTSTPRATSPRPAATALGEEPTTSW